MQRAKAIVFSEVGKTTFHDIVLPDPGPNDISVEMEVSGISVGTERWAYLGKRAEVSFPLIPGYMGVGRVTKVGDAAANKGYAIGQHVNFSVSKLPEPYGKNWMGTHVSHAVVNVGDGPDFQQKSPQAFDYHQCEILPDGLDPLDASVAGLAAVALRGIEMATIPVGARVLVVGQGVIGQFAAQICRLKGARVMVSDVVDLRLKIASQLGAEVAVNSKKQSLADAAKAFAPDGFDIIIDTASIPEVVNEVFPLLKLRGKFVFQGWYPPPSKLDLNVFHQRIPTVYFPCAFCGPAVAAVMRWTRAGDIKARELITRVAKPSEASDVYATIAKGSEDYLGVAFDWRNA